MQECVLATGNAGKRVEILAYCVDLPLSIRLRSEFTDESPAEPASTFVENALIKAKHAASVSGLPAIADDSGLVVPSLGGAPGVKSARYAGIDATTAQCNALLLDNMRTLEGEQRQAYFCCALVYVHSEDDPCPIIAQGFWHGFISDSPKGDAGFGYDPVFFDPKEGCGAAEMLSERKNTLSHRGQAMQQFLPCLASIYAHGVSR